MKRRCAFTLIEMMLVITVLAILVSMLMPAIDRARKKGKQVICINNLHTMGHSLILYAADENRYMPFCNWLSIDRRKKWKGWLYTYPNLKTPDQVEQGAFWRYLNERDVYHCPSHRNHETGRGTQKLTSYMMSGMTQHYDRGGLWFRYSQFPGDKFIMWETNEKSPWWNDGSDFAWEGRSERLSFRHFGRASMLSVGGSVETFFSVEYDQKLAVPGGRLRFCPSHGTH
jgi:prepilin-type N-terminal cleavage/methylation domain-containing protein